MAANPKYQLTEEGYLARERVATHKSEYFQGDVYAMAGASEEHNTIVANLLYLLVGQLKGRPCKAYGSDMRVKVQRTGLYTYPDVVVVCGKAAFGDEKQDTILNPTILIEVLSPSTGAYDRGKKWDHYRTLDSLTDYLLVAQDEAKIEHFERHSDEQWLYSVTDNRQGALALSSIDCLIPLVDVYDKVEFPYAG